MQRFLSILAILGMAAGSAQALEPRDGWVVHDTTKSYGDLVEALRDAVKSAPIAIVTQASASDGARAQGHEIPGNRVFGLYRNDYARRMLAASVASGIEAPIRMYVTEDDDGNASLSYRRPTTVFNPYFDEGGAALRDLAAELDGIFENVAKTAISE
jgi:uncharacterized protein (DUF302 family)